MRPALSGANVLPGDAVPRTRTVNWPVHIGATGTP